MNEGIFPGFSAGRPVELYLPEIIHEETLQASGAFDIRDIPQVYAKFELEMQLRSSVAATLDVTRLFFNNDTVATNYGTEICIYQNATTNFSTQSFPSIGDVPAASSEANSFGQIHCTILNPADARLKTYHSQSYTRESSSGTLLVTAFGNWENTAPITRIQIRTDNHPTDLFVTGSMVRLIGWRRFRLQP